MKPRVFVTRRIPETGLQAIAALAELDVWEGELPPPYATLLERVRGADGLLCLLTDRIDAGLMDAAGASLRVISQMAVGFDNVDLAAATQRGIPVGHTPGVLTETTADFAWALLMAAARRVVEGDCYTREGRWKTWGPLTLLGRDVYGATLGVVGFGRIGQAVARRAAGFGMHILVSDSKRNPAAEAAVNAEATSLDDLLARSDFVSLHVSLTARSRGLISEERLRRMKPSAVLINTARGAVVDEAALYRALKEGWIGAAALDVTAEEPIPPDSPLLELENLVITPHIASASVGTRGRMAVMAAENLIAGLRGEPLAYCANPEVYRRGS